MSLPTLAKYPHAEQAVTNNVRVEAWFDGRYTWLQAFDNVTGATLLPARELSDANGFDSYGVRVSTFNDEIYIAYMLEDYPTYLRVQTSDPASLKTTASLTAVPYTASPVSAAMDGASTMDMVITGDYITIVYPTSTSDLSAVTRNLLGGPAIYTTVATNYATHNDLGSISLDAGPSGTYVALAYTTSTTVQYARITASTGVSGGSLSLTEIPASDYGVVSIRWTSPFTFDLMMSDADRTYTLLDARYLFPNSGTLLDKKRNLLASDQFEVEGKIYYYAKPSGGDNNRGIYLYSREGEFLGRHLEGFVYSNAFSLVRPMVEGSKVSSLHLCKQFPDGSQLLSLEYDLASRVTPVVHKNRLYFGGPLPVKYDGQSLIEMTTSEAPEITESFISGSGGLEEGQYSYKVYFETIDAKRGRLLSFPSVTVNEVAPDSFGNTGTVRVRGLAASRVDTNAVLYRTEVNGSVFYRAAQLPANDVLEIEFIDFLNDEQLSQNEIDPYNGSELENHALPAVRYFASGPTRLWAILERYPNRAYYSKLEDEDLAVEFNLNAYIEFQDDLTGISFVRSQAVFFSEDRCWSVAGEGPNNTSSQGSFGEPTLISSNVGLINPLCCVETPMGVVFQSKRGIWKVDQQGQAKPLAETETYQSNPITSGVVIPHRNQLRLMSSAGRMLVWDYEYNMWFTFSGLEGVGATIWEDQYAYVKPDGSVYVEDESLHTDDGVTVLTSMVTSWLKPNNARDGIAKLNGHARVRRFHLLGTEHSNTLLRVSVAYDYEEEYSSEFLVRSEDLPAVKLRVARQKAASYRFKIEEVDDGRNKAGVGLAAISLEVKTLNGGSRVKRDR